MKVVEARPTSAKATAGKPAETSVKAERPAKPVEPAATLPKAVKPVEAKLIIEEEPVLVEEENGGV